MADTPNPPAAMEPRAPNANEQFCRGCGRVISKLAPACPFCGAPTHDHPPNASDKSRLAALLLCLCLGVFGVHRFYVGKIGTGLLQLVTIGGLGIWSTVDFILIAVGAFKDKQGRKVVRWMVDA
jgi:TM2 domain-containing membrane protein YozV